MAKSFVAQTIISIIAIVATMLLVLAAFINPRFDDIQASVDRVYNHIDNHMQSDINALEEDVGNLESRVSQAHIEREALAAMITALADGKDAETIASIWKVVSKPD